MELMKISKFKLQLKTLISEFNHLKEKERFASDQVQLLNQKKEKSKEEFDNKLRELRSELALSNEIRHKLETKVSCLENDNEMLERSQKELNEGLNNLLQSREAFVKAYEDSTCEMRRAVETRDRTIGMLYQKIKAHLLNFNSIEKEASSVKEAVQNVECILREKEDLVSSLQRKVDEVSTFEKLFIDRIRDLEGKLKNQELEVRRRDKIISKLEADLEATKISGNECKPMTEEIQRALAAKELMIDNLISEKKILQLEVGTLGIVVKKIQDAVFRINEEDRKIFSSMFIDQEDHATDGKSEITRDENVVPNNGEVSHEDASEKDFIQNEGT
ncbi:hypothetical protein Leryth_019414 [Lithospermum erythrorhizon]|nr:hypothetical protein Leryth_019414 [Lithospermum erythrorhizon]